MPLPSRSPLALAVALVVAGSLLAGCATEPAPEPEAVVDLPLPFDPTEPYDIPRWWSNGVEMLRLDDVGSYVLYAGVNRYHPPRERGSWSKRSYAELRLSPYDVLRHDAARVQVSKVEGDIVLVLPDLAPMRAIDGPPPAPEDDLLGTWAGGSGTLVLAPDLSYTFSPDHIRGGAAIVAGHQGRWRLDDDRVRLDPMVTAMGPFELRLEERDGRTVLRSEAMMFEGPTPLDAPEPMR